MSPDDADAKELRMRPYAEDDFLKIRDFLAATYGYFQRSYNWTIERWNFSVSVARTMHAISMDAWASQIGIWEEKGEIVGVANAEGEDDGEAFLQLASEQVPASLLQEMLAFCEERMGKVEGDKRTVRLFVPSGDVRLEMLVEDRGFVRQAWMDHDAILDVDDEFPVVLPLGYAFVDGTGVSPEEKGKVHAKAFGYIDDPVYPPRAVEGFRRMAETPDYRADLDMHVRAPDGEIAAFATMWYDARNRIGILEPVGTVPVHRKLGLGRAAIYHLVNLVRSQGARRIHVGSDQAFYQRLGFVVTDKYSVWHKEIA